jgi:hypothetical protein
VAHDRGNVARLVRADSGTRHRPMFRNGPETGQTAGSSSGRVATDALGTSSLTSSERAMDECSQSLWSLAVGGAAYGCKRWIALAWPRTLVSVKLVPG